MTSAIVRSYVWGLQVGAYAGWALEVATNPIVVWDQAPGTSWQRLHFKIRDVFWSWSSNVYTLDYVVERAWNTFGYMPGEYDTPAYAAFLGGIVPGCPAVQIDAGGPTVLFPVALPAPPTGYWRGGFPNCG